MTYTRWMRSLGIAVCLGLASTAWGAQPTAASASVQDLIAASQAKEDDPAFAVPTVENPIPKTEIHNLEIVNEDGRWLVSDKALAMYGIRPADTKKGTYWVQVPNPDGTVPAAKQRVALRLPGQDAPEGRTINIKHIRRPLGISYVLNPDSMELLPPAETVQQTVTLQPVTETGAQPVQSATRPIETVLFWDPIMDENQTLPTLQHDRAVMSPCAFRLSKDGVILRNPDFDMLAERYAENGYQMWPLVDNAFDAALTHDILQSPSLQEKMIQELIGYALLYQFRGYNLDFENVRYADKDKLTAFVQNISRAVHAYGIQLSMDVTPPSDSPNWSLVYDRQALAPALDYMMVMAYDQYGRTSPVAGPAASYPWVEKAVQQMTKLVPPEKIILGMPLYMRIWYESRDGNELPKELADWPAVAAAKPAAATLREPPALPYQPILPAVTVRPVALDAAYPALAASAAPRQAMALPPEAYAAREENGGQAKKLKLFVRTLTLADSLAIKEKYHNELHWDDTLRLYYLELPLVTGTVKIWFEDEPSLKEKAGLIKTYHLGGAAFWRKGFEPDSFWQGFAKHELT